MSLRSSLRAVAPTLLRIARLSAAACVLIASARADWVSLSGAENAPNTCEIHVDEDGVTLRLEIFVEDVVTFDRLVPDEYLTGLDVERPPTAERLLAFAREDFRIVADGERPLTASLERFEPRLRTERPSPNAGKLNPFTMRLIPGPPEDRRVLYAELVYPFESRPRSLTITPPVDERGTPRVTIGFITYHAGVPVNDFRFLPGEVTLDLDWDDPWYSSFEQRTLKRWQRGSVMSFLYVEPLEVRHEILARVKDLAAWMDLGLRGDEFIEADENEALKQRVGEFLLAQDRVTIDGRELRPVLDRTAFVKYSMTGSTFLVAPERLPIHTATLGVILTYPTDEIAQEVRVEWNLWSERIESVPTDAIDPAGPFPGRLTPDDNVQVWTNFLKAYTPPTVVPVELDASLTTLDVPLATLGCLALVVLVAVHASARVRRGQTVLAHGALVVALAGAGFLLRSTLYVPVPRPQLLAPQLTDAEAELVLHELLRNTYRSFDFRREEDVYDRLATCVSGELLADVYLEHRRSLEVTQAGGAQARVQTVEILGATVGHLASPRLAMSYRARWTAEGSVNHWGHLHTRKNLYEAEVTVEPVDGAWRITGLRVLDEKRIDANAGAAS